MAYFTSQGQVESAISALKSDGYADNQISLLAHETAQDVSDLLAGVSETDAAQGAAVGGGLGAALGLLGAVAVTPVPGIGPFVASGIMASAVTGIGGGYLGALFSTRSGTRSPIEMKERMEREGGATLIVHSTAKLDNAIRLLEQNGGELAGRYEINEEAVE